MLKGSPYRASWVLYTARRRWLGPLPLSSIEWGSGSRVNFFMSWTQRSTDSVLWMFQKELKSKSSDASSKYKRYLNLWTLADHDVGFSRGEVVFYTIKIIVKTVHVGEVDEVWETIKTSPALVTKSRNESLAWGHLLSSPRWRLQGFIICSHTEFW